MTTQALGILDGQAAVLQDVSESLGHLAQSLVDFPSQTLCDRTAVFEVLGDELEPFPVVQPLPHVVGIGLCDSM